MNYSGLDQRLRDARYAANLSVEQAAEGAMVTIAQIEDMESGGFNDLPPEPYRAALVCQYSEFIGVDTDVIYGITNEQSGNDHQINRQLSRFRFAAAATLFLLVLAISWFLVIGPTGEVSEVVDESIKSEIVKFKVVSTGDFIVYVDGTLVHNEEFSSGSEKTFFADESIAIKVHSIDAVSAVSYNDNSVRPDGIPRHPRWLHFGAAQSEASLVR
jgi:transcriptional regulator with XRE-family HTH domain